MNDLYTTINLLTLTTNLFFWSVLLLALVCTLVADEFLENCNGIIAFFLKLGTQHSKLNKSNKSVPNSLV